MFFVSDRIWNGTSLSEQMNTTHILHTIRLLVSSLFNSFSFHFYSQLCEWKSCSFTLVLALSVFFFGWRHRQGNSLNILAAKHDMKTATYDNLKFYLVVIQLETNSIAFYAGLTFICSIFFFFRHFCFRLYHLSLQ